MPVISLNISPTFAGEGYKAPRKHVNLRGAVSCVNLDDGGIIPPPRSRFDGG